MPALSQIPPFVAGLPHLLLRGRGGGFAFDGRRRPYFYDRYNFTWLNERAVEIPLALDAIDGRRPGSPILEVGNVLAHYGRRGHEVVDKYERAPGVRNIDVLSLPDDGRRYDLIVSISTLEHVGVDDDTGDPARAIAAVRLLQGRVAPGGRLFVTVPMGWNRTLEHALLDGEIAGLRLDGLRRTGRGPRWGQVEPASLRDLPYDHVAKSAAGLLVARADGPPVSS